MAWIQKAPGRFTLYARNPKYDVSIGGDTTVFAAGYGETFIVDATGVKRNASLEDYLDFLKLVQQCDLFSINGGCSFNHPTSPMRSPFPCCCSRVFCILTNA